MDLVAAERASLWAIRRESLGEEDFARRVADAKNMTLATWQARWSLDDGKASWTKAFLPSVSRWLESDGPERLTFHLTQALTGHGCFGSYLYKFRKVVSPYCQWCPGVTDNPDHTLFNCEKFNDERRGITRLLDKVVAKEDVQRILCGEEGTRWIMNAALKDNVRRIEDGRRTEFVRMVTAILTFKEADERARQAAARVNRAPCRRRGGRRPAMPAPPWSHRPSRWIYLYCLFSFYINDALPVICRGSWRDCAAPGQMIAMATAVFRGIIWLLIVFMLITIWLLSLLTFLLFDIIVLLFVFLSDCYYYRTFNTDFLWLLLSHCYIIWLLFDIARLLLSDCYY